MVKIHEFGIYELYKCSFSWQIWQNNYETNLGNLKSPTLRFKNGGILEEIFGPKINGFWPKKNKERNWIKNIMAKS